MGFLPVKRAPGSGTFDPIGSLAMLASRTSRVNAAPAHSAGREGTNALKLCTTSPCGASRGASAGAGGAQCAMRTGRVVLAMMLLVAPPKIIWRSLLCV